MTNNRFTTDSKIGEWLQQPGVLEKLNKFAPGMTESSTFTYVKEMSVNDMGGAVSDEQLKLFTSLIELANGQAFTYVKSDAPELPKVSGRALTYNIDDVDGQMYMLDRGFSGCLILRFTKKMDESLYGRISLDGTDLPKGMLKSLELAGGNQMLGVFVRDIFTEYGHEYNLLIEGFADREGNLMEPQTITVKTQPKTVENPKYAANDAVALEAAREGIVMLKNNNGILPLAPNCTLHLVGANDFRIGAAGAGRINPRYSVRLHRAISEYSDFKTSEVTDTAVFVVCRGTGENLDASSVKGEFYLTDDEEAAVQKLSGKYKNTIAIINSGYPIDLRWVEKYGIGAVLWCGYPGMLGGKALVEILDGRVNPSAKLPDTWSLDYHDIPASANFYNAVDGKPVLSTDSPYFVDTVYEEDIYVGYRYFETFGKPVMYPFGYGLSYTDFVINAGDANPSAVNVTVTNKGKQPGKEVVQVYVKIPDGKLEQPDKRLVGFAKTILLAPGETEEIVIEIPKDRLGSYDESTARWLMEKGNYEYHVGNSVKNLVKCCSFTLDEDEILKQVENRMVPPVKIKLLSKHTNEFPKGKHSGLKQGVTTLDPKAVRKHYTDEPLEAEDFVSDLSIEELARLSVCASSGWGMHQKGEAGRIFKIRNLPDYVVADGNNGVNVNNPNIGMPCSNTVCASFNADLAYRIGKTIAAEAKDNGINMILAPGMNMHRNPLNGRHPEYFSEDPVLTGIMAGNQSKGLEDSGVSSSIKHVVANNCETARKRNHSIVTERALRELYLKGFEIAISVNMPDSIMTAYNAVNGVFTSEDEEMIIGIFRKEFGFDGFVMTDWNAYDTADVVASIQAGNCWMTPGNTDDTYVTPIVNGVLDGKIDIERLRSNVRYMLRVVQKRTGEDLGV